VGFVARNTLISEDSFLTSAFGCGHNTALIGKAAASITDPQGRFGMKSPVACIVLCFLALAGCAHTNTAHHSVDYDYDVNFDFTRVKTYDWVSMPGTLRIDQFNRTRIQNVVDSQMDAKGLKIAKRDPDVFLVMYGGDRKEVDMTAMMTYEVYKVGRLKLALYDAKTNEEIWWAETRADLFHHMTPDEKDRVIAFAVHRIMEHYPPAP
jgi:hypothetical protein